MIISVNSFAIHTFRLTKSFLFNCYQHVVNVFVGIWQNASNFTFTPSSIQPQEQHRFDDAQMVFLIKFKIFLVVIAYSFTNS